MLYQSNHEHTLRKGGLKVDMEGKLGGNDFWWKGVWGVWDAWVLGMGQGDKDVCNGVG